MSIAQITLPALPQSAVEFNPQPDLPAAIDAKPLDNPNNRSRSNHAPIRVHQVAPNGPSHPCLAIGMTTY